jgi:hypothetical protein
MQFDGLENKLSSEQGNYCNCMDLFSMFSWQILGNSAGLLQLLPFLDCCAVTSKYCMYSLASSASED